MKNTTFLTFSVLLAFSLVLTGCFSGGNESREELADALDLKQSWESYQFQGSSDIVMKTPLDEPLPDALADSRIEWSGKRTNTPAATEMDIEWTAGEEKLQGSFLFQQDRTYIHLPLLNEEQEWIAAAPVPLMTGKADFLLSFLVEAAAETKAELYRKTVEDSGETTLTVTIEDENWPLWRQALQDMLGGLPDAFSGLPGKSVLTEPGEFRLTLNEDGQIASLALSIDTDVFSLAVQQTYSAIGETGIGRNVDNALVIPAEVIAEQLKRMLGGEQEHRPEIPFEPAIALKKEYEYSGDAARQQITALIKENMQALVDRNREQFDATFRKEPFAKRHEDLWNRDRKYRFLHIEDLRFKSLNGSVRAGVLYEYVEPGDTAVSISGFTYTLNRNEQGEWKIDRIE